jgi:hypothetical protein
LDLGAKLSVLGMRLKVNYSAIPHVSVRLNNYEYFFFLGC